MKYSQTLLYILSAIRIFDSHTIFFQCNICNTYQNFVIRTLLNVLYFILRTLLDVRTSLNVLYFILRTLLNVL